MLQKKPTSLLQNDSILAAKQPHSLLQRKETVLYFLAKHVIFYIARRPYSCCTNGSICFCKKAPILFGRKVIFYIAKTALFFVIRTVIFVFRLKNCPLHIAKISFSFSCCKTVLFLCFECKIISYFQRKG